MQRIIFGFVFLASACQADETISAYAPVRGDYTLLSLDGEPIEGTATINVSEMGRISGRAPCNRYFADQKADYPWFELGPIVATRMACPYARSEEVYLKALEEMTLAEAHRNILVLYNTQGRELVFHAP